MSTSSHAPTPTRPPAFSALRATSTLALWGAALAAGTSPDAVLDQLNEPGMPVGVRAHTTGIARQCGIPGPGEAHGSSTDLLSLLRRGGPAGVLLPVPGDVRGLPVGGEVTRPALEAGALVTFRESGIALVPTVGHWRVYHCDVEHPTLSERDVRRIVDDALRESSDVVSRADVARSAGHPREAIRREILREEIPLPRGVPHASAELLARSITLQAVFAVASRHETAAVTARQLDTVPRALAPLTAAVRESRRTAIALAVAAIHPTGHPLARSGAGATSVAITDLLGGKS